MISRAAPLLASRHLPAPASATLHSTRSQHYLNSSALSVHPFPLVFSLASSSSPPTHPPSPRRTKASLRIRTSLRRSIPILIMQTGAQSKPDISPLGRAAAGATGAVLANALVYPLENILRVAVLSPLCSRSPKLTNPLSAASRHAYKCKSGATTRQRRQGRMTCRTTPRHGTQLHGSWPTTA